jgi:hypothetical protein
MSTALETFTGTPVPGRHPSSHRSTHTP